MWWYIGLAAVFVLVLFLHERSVRRRFEDAQAELRENRALDAKIYRLYHDIEEMLDSFEAYVGEVHDELESRREELLIMSRQATTLYMQVMAPETRFRADTIPKPPAAEAPENPRPAVIGEPKPEKTAEPQKEEKSKLTPRDRAELDKLTGKGKKIRFLMGKGLNLSEIARELGIGKGEIRLILDLDKD